MQGTKKFSHILPGMICCLVSVRLPCLFSPFPFSERMSACLDYNRLTDAMDHVNRSLILLHQSVLDLQ